MRTLRSTRRSTGRRPSGRSGAGVQRGTSRVLILKSRFRYAGRATHFGHALLYGDRLELVHWTWKGRCARSIPLAQILDVDYHPVDADGNLRLVLEGDEVLGLEVETAHQWREHFERWFRYAVLPSAKLMGPDTDKAASMSG